MEARVAKELLHIQSWLEWVDAIVARGRDAYLADPLLQEAGDSLMMKVGEAANRLASLGLAAPAGVDWALAVANRNFIVHRYHRVDRAMTWLTLSVDLPRWRIALASLFVEAAASVSGD
ncbi:HepT-like ribonuclease domain-containing protein [Demequina pelophila]|uniref:HepT-like ribonuclease domain-containing protein n=1 Tax=Demequina pelophila TaxID=1638984 RepID=UPI0007812208|nr:HepT-like ribonuclease domain-containing protein [Demequina pelophila]